MIYLALKALHVASVLTFVAGLLVLARSMTTDNLVMLRATRRWDRRVTLPALALVWASGLAIALLGHWFGAAWLSMKLVLVVALSMLHGVLAGTLRRAEQHAGSSRVPPSLATFAPPAIVVTAALVACLAVLKFG